MTARWASRSLEVGLRRQVQLKTEGRLSPIHALFGHDPMAEDSVVLSVVLPWKQTSSTGPGPMSSIGAQRLGQEIQWPR